MTVSDPIADMLTRIRNGVMARHDVVSMPASRTKIDIARVLKEEGFLEDYEVLKDSPQRTLKVRLRYAGNKQPIITGLRRVSKLGLRQYVGNDAIPNVRGGLGVALITTSQGVMTGRKARSKGVGGEVICYVW